MMYLAVASLIALVVRVPARYGWAALVHPALWYAAAWLVALGCYGAMELVGAVPVHSERLFNELMGFIALTSGAFLVLTLLGPKRKAQQRQAGDVRLVPGSFRAPIAIFAAVGVLGALINWVVLGAPLGYDDALRRQWLEEIPVITARTWYLYLWTFPAAIAAGWIFIVHVVRGEAPGWKGRAVLAAPLFAGLLWAMATGGRQALGMVLLHALIGVAFGWQAAMRSGYVVPRARLWKIASRLAVGVVIFSLFIGLTGQARARQQRTDADGFDRVWFLAPVGQFILYMGLTVATYQAYGTPVQRDLSETGPVTFAGLQEFGLRFVTDWRRVTVDDTNPERAMASSGLPLASGVRNVFYDLQADFGLEGAAVACVLLAGLSHLLFLLRPRLTRRMSMRSLVPLATALMFWGYSHQFSLLMFNTPFWLLVSALLWDVGTALLWPKPPELSQPVLRRTEGAG